MITQLGTPSVCLIDDEADDYEPMLAALLRQGIGAVHVRGTDLESTPPEPFKGLRLVLTDLHLGSSSSQKDHASHTAAVFRKTVSPAHGPVIVVVWSKFADELVPTEEFASPPEDDQPDLGELFIQEVIDADTRFKDMAVFTRIPKPKKESRESGEWVAQLQSEIEGVLARYPGIGFLSEWECLVRASCMSVSHDLIDLTTSLKGTDSLDEGDFDDSVQHVLRLLACEHGGSSISPETAGGHLSTVLSQILSDQLEKTVGTHRFNNDFNWITTDSQTEVPKLTKARINTSLLATAVDPNVPAFFPGMVYSVTDAAAFCAAFGASLDDLYLDFHKKLTAADRAKPDSWQ